MTGTNQELEKLYALRTKATSRKEIAQRNISSKQKQIAELESCIRYDQGELSMAEYFLEYIDQCIGELKNMGENQ